MPDADPSIPIGPGDLAPAGADGAIFEGGGDLAPSSPGATVAIGAGDLAPAAPLPVAGFLDQTVTLISALYAEGVTLTVTQMEAFDAFYAGGWVDGSSYGNHHAWLPVWDNAQANLIDLATGAKNTAYSAITAEPGYIQGGGGSYGEVLDAANLSPADIGMTNEAGTMWAILHAVGTTAGSLLATNLGTTSRARLAIDPSGDLIEFDFLGSDSPGRTQHSMTSLGRGVILASRHSGTTHVAHYTEAAGYDATAATKAGIGTAPDLKMGILTQQNSGSESNKSDGSLGAFGYSSAGMSATEQQAFMAAVKTLWETVTGLSLP